MFCLVCIVFITLIFNVDPIINSETTLVTPMWTIPESSYNIIFMFKKLYVKSKLAVFIKCQLVFKSQKKRLTNEERSESAKYEYGYFSYYFTTSSYRH